MRSNASLPHKGPLTNCPKPWHGSLFVALFSKKRKIDIRRLWKTFQISASHSSDLEGFRSLDFYAVYSCRNLPTLRLKLSTLSSVLAPCTGYIRASVSPPYHLVTETDSVNNQMCLLPTVLMLCSVYSLPTEILLVPWLRCLRAFPSVVRQISGYTSQRRYTVRTLPNQWIVLFYVLFVCKCVLYSWVYSSPLCYRKFM